MGKSGFSLDKKRSEDSIPSNSKTLLIPNTIFSDDKLAILEAIIEYLKEEKELNYKEIGDLLERDQRNVWTVYSRVRKKRKITKRIPTSKPKLFVPI